MRVGSLLLCKFANVSLTVAIIAHHLMGKSMWHGSRLCTVMHGFTFTFTRGKHSMLSSAEAVISFGPICSPEITERLYKFL